MRAGTLSDPRVIALLRKYFVAVEMTELVTKDLIENPADVALLERYDRMLSTGPPQLRPGLRGGEREVFFTPAGEVADICLTLHCGPEVDGRRGLYCRAEREQPDAAVERFFTGAARAYDRAFGAMPRDWQRLLDGTAAEVEAVRKLAVPPPPAPAGGLALRLWVRADVIMYDGLAGSEVVHLTGAEARRLLPDRLAAGRTHPWPRDLFLRLARLAFPRGAGVLVRLDDTSVHGSLETEVDRVSDHAVHGRLRGSLRLEPRSDRERGRREHYRPWRRTAARLAGTFVWDPDRGRFTSFRLVSRDGRSTFAYGDEKDQSYRLGIELLAPTGSAGHSARPVSAQPRDPPVTPTTPPQPAPATRSLPRNQIKVPHRRNRD